MKKSEEIVNMVLSMGRLVASEIRRLIATENMISGYISLDSQLQPAGFDVSLSHVKVIDDMRPHSLAEAKSAFNNSKIVDLSEPLQPLKPYLLITNEMFTMPDDVSGDCRTRSTLTRVSIVLGSGMIDPGYVGHLSFSMISTLPVILHHGDQIVQVTFERHERTFKYHGQYNEPVVAQVHTF